MKTADGGGHRHDRKYKKEEADDLVPEDVKWPDNAGQDVLYELTGGPAHGATLQCSEPALLKPRSRSDI